MTNHRWIEAVTLPPPDLFARARCAAKGVDPEIFFPRPAEDASEALSYCWGECPIQVECLRWALENRIDHGVWGGMTARARIALFPSLPPREAPVVRSLLPKEKLAGRPRTRLLCPHCSAEWESRAAPLSRVRCPDCRAKVSVVNNRLKRDA